MARKAKKRNVGSHVFWRNGRAYGDFLLDHIAMIEVIHAAKVR